ncbi:transposase [Orientia tsutsugamushi]|uniref:transposase n=2 Tax=Orientia tsutsugamushi TaxID=784 RepID=UPI0002F3E805|nr:transposase [Orientia tsutsugamushi]
MQQVLINELEPAQFVVMDNAAFHKSKKTKELIESVGCKVIFLPPYSPDLNPIEKFSANMKLWIKHQITQFANSIISFFYAQTSFVNDYKYIA